MLIDELSWKYAQNGHIPPFMLRKISSFETVLVCNKEKSLNISNRTKVIYPND